MKSILCLSATKIQRITQKFEGMEGKYTLLLDYQGKINQEIIKDIFQLVEKKLNGTKDHIALKKRITHIAVELLQNISKYSCEGGQGSGVFFIAKNGEEYCLIAGNEVSCNQLMLLSYVIDSANQELFTDRMNELFDSKIVYGRVTNQGGAGLGLIDIARRSKRRMEYCIDPLKNGNAIFYIKVTVAKKNSASKFL